MAKRILIVNKFYYNRGGDCVVAINTEHLLRDNGYDVAVYAMQYPENFQSPYDKYFAPQIDFSGSGIKGKLKAFQRTLGIGDIRASFASILRDFRPDIVHLNNIHSYISPVVAEMAKNFGCKVVWTMHDYKLLCPSYSCLRDGKPCELCFTDKRQVLNTRCMKGSLAASALAYLEAMKWNRARLSRCTDTFICPSQFMASKMIQGGFAPDKLKVICNFVDPIKLKRLTDTPNGERMPYYCYVGRLSEEKGVATLLEAASQVPYELRIAGDGPLAEPLKRKYSDCNNIIWLGRLDATGVAQLLSQAKCSAITSECYENNPLGVIESLCAGTPVVGAKIGGIPELIDADSGIIFQSGNVDSLTSAITRAFSTNWDTDKIKVRSISRFSPQTHLKELEAAYGSSVSPKEQRN